VIQELILKFNNIIFFY